MEAITSNLKAYQKVTGFRVKTSGMVIFQRYWSSWTKINAQTMISAITPTI
jgi:hypothetical protein